MDGCKDVVVDEFEKKSAALVNYVNSLDAAYERQRLDFEHRECQWKREKAELKYMLESALDRARRLDHDKSVLTKEKERLLEKVQELEARIEELVREMQRKDELYNYRRKREERARRRLEMENKALKKKATVGWMLGSLCEIYLEGAADGGTLPLILMLRKLQKDLERESANVDIDIKISTDSIKKEVNKLLSRSGSRSPRLEVRIDSRPSSAASDDEHRRKPGRSGSPKARSPSCSRSPFCPRGSGSCSPCSPRAASRSPTSRSPYSTRAKTPVSRSPSPISRRSCSRKTKSRSPSPCTTLTVNLDSDMPEEPVAIRCSSQPGGHIDTVEIFDSERKRRWRESQFKSLGYSSPRSKT